MIRRKTASEKEPTVTLINIVFLMLIFFLIAGQLAPPLDGRLELIETRELEARPPPDTLVIHADGAMTLRGLPVASAGAFVAGLSEAARTAVRIVPDRNLAASELVRIASALRAAGAGRVVIVSERALG